MKTVTVSTIEEYCTAIYDITVQLGNRPQHWWRGQANSDWKLTPSLYHKRKAYKETEMARDFINQASVRCNSVPPVDDYTGWLFLMQHYGLPTRLLDWTKSPLVALHFATLKCEKGDEDTDASVWGLDPLSLNASQYGYNMIASPNHKDVNDLVKIAIEDKRIIAPDKTIAIECKHDDLRQLVQMSEFTLHGSWRPMEKYADAEKFLGKMIIPKEHKQHFRERLLLFGLYESYLFPDLEHLAEHVQNEHRISDLIHSVCQPEDWPEGFIPSAEDWPPGIPPGP